MSLIIGILLLFQVSLSYPSNLGFIQINSDSGTMLAQVQTINALDVEVTVNKINGDLLLVNQTSDYIKLKAYSSSKSNKYIFRRVDPNGPWRLVKSNEKLKVLKVRFLK